MQKNQCGTEFTGDDRIPLRKIAFRCGFIVFRCGNFQSAFVWRHFALEICMSMLVGSISRWWEPLRFGIFLFSDGMDVIATKTTTIHLNRSLWSLGVRLITLVKTHFSQWIFRLQEVWITLEAAVCKGWQEEGSDYGICFPIPEVSHVYSLDRNAFVRLRPESYLRFIVFAINI